MINIKEMPFIDLIMITLAILIVLYILKMRNNSKPKAKLIYNSRKFLNKGYFDYKTIKLRNSYIRLHGDTRMSAAEALDRQIDTLRRKHPNKEMTWYIDKAIYDLKRDRHII